jgi:hypothetical protein
MDELFKRGLPNSVRTIDGIVYHYGHDGVVNQITASISASDSGSGRSSGSGSGIGSGRSSGSGWSSGSNFQNYNNQILGRTAENEGYVPISHQIARDIAIAAQNIGYDRLSPEDLDRVISANEKIRDGFGNRKRWDEWDKKVIQARQAKERQLEKRRQAHLDRQAQEAREEAYINPLMEMLHINLQAGREGREPNSKESRMLEELYQKLSPEQQEYLMTPEGDYIWDPLNKQHKEKVATEPKFSFGLNWDETNPKNSRPIKFTPIHVERDPIKDLIPDNTVKELKNTIAQLKEPKNKELIGQFIDPTQYEALKNNLGEDLSKIDEPDKEVPWNVDVPLKAKYQVSPDLAIEGAIDLGIGGKGVKLGGSDKYGRIGVNYKFGGARRPNIPKVKKDSDIELAKKDLGITDEHLKLLEEGKIDELYNLWSKAGEAVGEEKDKLKLDKNGWFTGKGWFRGNKVIEPKMSNESGKGWFSSKDWDKPAVKKADPDIELAKKDLGITDKQIEQLSRGQIDPLLADINRYTRNKKNNENGNMNEIEARKMLLKEGMRLMKNGRNNGLLSSWKSALTPSWEESWIEPMLSNNYNKTGRSYML